MTTYDKQLNLTLKRLKHRNGLFLKDIWVHHLVDNNDISPVQDILESLKDSLNFDKTERERLLEEVTIPIALMHEMNRLVYKALVTGRSFVRDLSSGQHSHAEVTAYTGCLFWARCILLILGVWISPKKLNNSFWIIDIYPEKEKKIDSSFNFIQMGPHQPGHREIWLALKRILCPRTSKNLPVDTLFLTFINDIDETTIGFKRHHIQYFNHYWIYENDLKLDSININDLSWIKDFNESIYNNLDLTNCDPENSVVYLYLILARNFYLLIQELKNYLPETFNNELLNITSSFEFIEVFNIKGWFKTENI